jgi:hypothetical protein
VNLILLHGQVGFWDEAAYAAAAAVAVVVFVVLVIARAKASKE